jgi:hypothetical protein
MRLSLVGARLLTLSALAKGSVPKNALTEFSHSRMLYAQRLCHNGSFRLAFCTGFVGRGFQPRHTLCLAQTSAYSRTLYARCIPA